MMKNRLPFAAIPHSLVLDQRISDGAYRMYALLLKYSWKTGSTHVSQQRLCEDLQISRTTAYRRLAELEDVGLISVSQRGRGLTNDIEILPVDQLPQGMLETELPSPAREVLGLWGRAATAAGAIAMCWGEFPISRVDVAPLRRRPYVYALFDSDGRLRHVEATKSARARLTAHSLQRTGFAFWAAVQMETMEAALDFADSQMDVQASPVSGYDDASLKPEVVHG